MVEKKIGVYDAKSDAKLPGNVLDSLNNALGTELLEKLEALGAEASGVKKVEDAIDKTVKNIAEETTTNPENYQGRAVAPKTGLLTTEDDEKEEENDEEVTPHKIILQPKKPKPTIIREPRPKKYKIQIPKGKRLFTRPPMVVPVQKPPVQKLKPIQKKKTVKKKAVKKKRR